MRRATLYIIISFFIWGCLEKMPLPSDINVNTEFVAGDTTYLLVNPIWDDTYGFITPIEISIAPDGHVFVADSSSLDKISTIGMFLWLIQQQNLFLC